MSLTKDIYLAFSAKLAAFAANHSPALPVDYVGAPISFTPPTAGEWLEAVPFFNGNENYAWDQGSIEQGFFRVGVCTRLGGLVVAQTLAELIATEFKKTTALSTALVYQEPQISGPLQEDDRLTVPVSIYWRGAR